MEDYSVFYKSMEPNYIAMGRMLHAWDRVEGGWGYFFETLFKDHPFSQRVFFSSSAFSAKVSLTERLLEVASVPEKESALRLLKRSDKLSKRRNNIVHGAWVTISPSQAIRVAVNKDHDDTAAVAAAYMTKKDQKLADRAYDAARMLDLADEIQTLAEEIFTIAEKLRSS